jgi:alpha-galactosidase
MPAVHNGSKHQGGGESAGDGPGGHAPGLIVRRANVAAGRQGIRGVAPVKTMNLRTGSGTCACIIGLALASSDCGSSSKEPPTGDSSSPEAGQSHLEAGEPSPDAASSSSGGEDSSAAGSDSSSGGGEEAGSSDDAEVDGTTPTPDAGAREASSESGPPDGATSGLLGAQPLMGWSSWSTLEDNVSETKLKAVADAVASQLLPYGYQYINIDDGWYGGYDANGRREPDTSKFPDGISGLATYVHGKGLKLGIYLIPGLNDTVYNANSPILGTTYHAKDIVSDTSASGNTDKASGQTAKQIDYTKPGAVEYIESYANLLASWGVDYVKMDFVGPGGGGGTANNEPDIQQWRAALDKTGRPIWLELSNKLSIAAIATWKAYSNGWRIQDDVECYCSTLTNWEHVSRNITSVAPWVQYAGPGGWNDLDSTEIGNGSHDGITADERRTMFSFWSISAAPLSLGTDPTSMDPTDLTLLTNKEVIAVDQAGIAGRPVSTATNQQVWYTKNPDGSFIVGLFNLDASTATVTAKWSDVGAGSSMNVRDLWSQTNLGSMSASFSASVPSHGTRLLKLTP